MTAEKRIGVLSDTHGLLRPGVMERLAGCDLIIHAGDMGGSDVLDALRHIARVVAVKGNTDRGDCGLRETEYVEFEGKRIYVIHNRAALDVVPESMGLDIVVFGHSHQPLVEYRNGVMFLNPGSAGPRRFSLPVSIASVWIKDGKIVPGIIEIMSSPAGA